VSQPVFIAHNIAKDSYISNLIRKTPAHEGGQFMGKYSINKTDQAGEITGTMDLEVKAYPIREPKGNTKAFASVTIDGMFGIHGISVIEGKNGLFASMPQTRDKTGGFRDVAHPVTSEGRKALNEAVLSEYAVALGELEVKQESTLAKIKEAKEAATARPAPDKAAAKEAVKSAKSKADDGR